MELKLNRNFSKQIIIDLLNKIKGSSPDYRLALILSYDSGRENIDTGSFRDAGIESIINNNGIDIQYIKRIAADTSPEIFAGVVSPNGNVTFNSIKYIMDEPSTAVGSQNDTDYEYIYITTEVLSDYKDAPGDAVKYNIVTLALIKSNVFSISKYDRYTEAEPVEQLPSISKDNTFILVQARPGNRKIAKTSGEGFEGGEPSQEEKEFKMLIKI